MIHYDNALHMMELQGGSFVRALAELYLRADAENKLRVRAAFADYFTEYKDRYFAWFAWKDKRSMVAVPEVKP